MKKRILPLLMASCMMASTVSPILAREESFDEVDENSFVQELDETTSYNGQGTKENQYKITIKSIQDFDSFVAFTRKQDSSTYYDVTLENNLNLNQSTYKLSQWGTYIPMFRGKFDGNGHNISGIPTNCCLFSGINDAEICNFTLELEGKAGTIAVTSKALDDQYGEEYLHDITVTSSQTVELEGAEQHNYSPFITFIGANFKMKGCTNYANLNGPIYGGVFCGGFVIPLNSKTPQACQLLFENCINYGNVSYMNAGLIFGNECCFNSIPEGTKIEVKNIKNLGHIFGTESAGFFSSGNNGKVLNSNLYCGQQEKTLLENVTLGNSKGDISYDKQALPDLGVIIVYREDGQKYFRVDNPDPNYDYVISVIKYVYAFDTPQATTIVGTDRITIDEPVNASNAYTTKEIFDAEIRDTTYSNNQKPDNLTLIKQEYNFYKCTDSNDQNYGYWIDSTNSATSGHYLYLNENKQSKTTKTMWDARVSAYEKTTGRLVATTNYSRPQEHTPTEQPGQKPTTLPVVVGWKDKNGFLDSREKITLTEGTLELTGLNLASGGTLEASVNVTDVVSLENKEGKILISPKKPGEAKITVKYTSNGTTEEKVFTITVEEPIEPSNPGGGSGGGGGSSVTGPTKEVKNAVYRAYNPNSGEHFYTPDYKEFKHITSIGWNDEGIACMTESATNGHTLYRLYNPNDGLHHYTLDETEKNILVSLGWNDEGVAWYTSKDEKDAAVYRLYNLNDGQHHYTMDSHERDVLVKLGWTYEGVGYRTSPIKK